MNNQNSEFQLNIETPEVSKNIADIIKYEASILENKYFRWIISIGISFLCLKAIDTAGELKYITGKQESYEKAIQTIFENRDETINNLRIENKELYNWEEQLKIINGHISAINESNLKNYESLNNNLHELIIKLDHLEAESSQYLKYIQNSEEHKENN